MFRQEDFKAMTKYIRDFFLVTLSSILLVLSFPEFNLGFLAWIGLVPFLITLIGKGLKYSFLLSFTGGIIYFAGVFNWILQVPGYTPLIHHPLLGLYLGPFFGLFGLSISFISRRWGVIPALSSAPFVWVPLEYIRSNLDFLALPWGLLAHSQYQYPVVIQIASIIGTYGISFLIVLVNAALAALVLEIKCHFKIGDSGSGNGFKVVIPLEESDSLVKTSTGKNDINAEAKIIGITPP